MKTIPIPAPGDLISEKYRLDEVLGRGGFGMVFKATHMEMDRAVALKTLLPAAATARGAAERFKREAVLASQLRHPNIITLFDFGQTEEGLMYLVMELLEGHTLSDELAADGAMDPERAKRLVIQVLGSLQQAHSQGIVHLDLKPENIFLCQVPGDPDFVKVLDFGVARMVASPEEQSQELSASLTFGTPKYMAPEQISALPVGPPTDLYALGLIIYEMLVGEPAYKGRSPLEIVASQLHHGVPALPDRLADTPLGLLYKAVAIKAFDDRIASAAEAIDVLIDKRTEASEPLAQVMELEVPDLAIITGGSSLLDEEGWSDSGDMGNFLEEAVLPDDIDAGPMDSDRTWVVSSPGDDLIAPEDLTAQLLLEGSLSGDDLGAPMEGEATTVLAGGFEFESKPTNAIFTLRDHDLMEMAEPAQISEMESEKTRVHPSRSGAIAQLQRRHQASDRSSRASESPSAKIEDSEKTDPNRNSPDAPDPAPEGEARDVLFTVGAEAGYIGQAKGVPGVHMPSNVDIVAIDKARRTGQIDAIDPNQPPTIPPPPNPSSAPIDKSLMAALAFLGMGMIAVLLVLIVILMLPYIRRDAGPDQPPPSVASAEPPRAAPVAKAVEPLPEAAKAIPEKAPEVAEVTPDAGTPDAEAVAEVDEPAEPVATRFVINSAPDGASVFIGDVLIDKTPCDFSRVVEGESIELTFKLSGHKDTTVLLKASPGVLELKHNAVMEPVAVAVKKTTSKPVAANKTPRKTTTRQPARKSPTVKKAKPPKKGGGKKPNPFGKW